MAEQASPAYAGAAAPAVLAPQPHALLRYLRGPQVQVGHPHRRVRASIAAVDEKPRQGGVCAGVAWRASVTDAGVVRYERGLWL